jgi:hypothetical protein
MPPPADGRSRNDREPGPGETGPEPAARWPQPPSPVVLRRGEGQPRRTPADSSRAATDRTRRTSARARKQSPMNMSERMRHTPPQRNPITALSRRLCWSSRRSVPPAWQIDVRGFRAGEVERHAEMLGDGLALLRRPPRPGRGGTWPLNRRSRRCGLRAAHQVGWACMPPIVPDHV